VDDGLARLEWFRANAATEPVTHLASAVGLAARLDEFEPRRGPLMLSLTQAVIEHHPSAPLQVYGAGMLALAQMRRVSDPEFERLAARAAESSRERSEEMLAGAATWRDLAQALTDAGYPEAAARALRARLRSDVPLEGRAFEVLAMALLAAGAASGEVEASIEMLRAWNAAGRLDLLSPSFDHPAPVTLPTALFEASQVHTLAGDEAGADRLLSLAIELEPGYAMAMNNLGYTRIESGRGDEATAALIERAAAMQPEDSSILDTLGWLRYKQERLTEEAEGGEPGAVALIRRAIEADAEPGAEVFDHLGDALWRAGDAAGALAAWQRATAILADPAFEDRMTRIYAFIQQQRWRLVVADAAAMYHRDFGLLLERTQRKIDDARAGGEPPVAPTFAELEAGPE
jgi:tetratricopeptide (TPR) repeat protein